MRTVAETIRHVQEELTDPSNETPRLDAELLVGHVLQLDRTRLLAGLRDTFPDGHDQELYRLVDRRKSGEPISLLFGYREFYGLRFAVSPAVLTPRPETEHLVEWALSELANRGSSTVVDVGTGSGAIAIAVAAHTD